VVVQQRQLLQGACLQAGEEAERQKGHADLMMQQLAALDWRS
jgi:hypothetical protein